MLNSKLAKYAFAVMCPELKFFINPGEVGVSPPDFVTEGFVWMGSWGSKSGDFSEIDRGWGIISSIWDGGESWEWLYY